MRCIYISGALISPIRILRLESTSQRQGQHNVAPESVGKDRIMSPIVAATIVMGVFALNGCASSGYCVRAVPQIAAGNVGKSVSRLQEAFGEPRKVDTTPTKQVYVWFLPLVPAGAPSGFHGCEMEVTVDARSQMVMGYSLTNIGWSTCREVERRIRIAPRN